MQYIPGSSQFEAHIQPHDAVGDSSSAAVGHIPENKTTFRRVMGSSEPSKLFYEQIEIDSVELQRLFAESCPIYTGPEAGSEVLTLRSPFEHLIWYWDDFEAACEPTLDDTPARVQAREDLSSLLDIVRSSPQLTRYFQARGIFADTGIMPHEYLWTLYPKGTRVFAKTYPGDTQLLEVHHCEVPRYADTLPTTVPSQAEWPDDLWSLTCGGFDWDGDRFVAVEYEIAIFKPRMNASTRVCDLEIYPSQFYRRCGECGKEGDGMKLWLAERGKRFVDICAGEAKGTPYKYDGPIEWPDSEGTHNKEPYRGAAVVDAHEYCEVEKFPAPISDLRGSIYVDDGCRWQVHPVRSVTYPL